MKNRNRFHCHTEVARRHAAIRSVLSQLREAHDLACAAERPVEEFAIPQPSLVAAVGSVAALHCLLDGGYIQHFVEVPRQRRRCVKPAIDLTLRNTSCFRLSANGLALARSVVLECHESSPRSFVHTPDATGKPCWL